MKEYTSASSAGRGQAPSSRGGLAGLSLAILLSSLATSVANVSLPTLTEVFSASFQSVQWVMIASLLSVTTFIVSVGRLGDIMGRRRLLLAGMVVFSVASTLCGVSPSLHWLIAARALQGLGAAIMTALAMAFVGEIVPKAKIGSAMGMLGSMSSLGTALGPSLGGILITFMGWRSIFLVNLPFGVVALALAYRCLPVDRRVSVPAQTRFDVLGTILLACTLASYALAMTLGRGRFSEANLALLGAAGLSGSIFVFAQSRVRSPLIPLSMFKNLELSASLVVSILVSTVLMATLFVGPFYLSVGLGLDTAHVGLTMSVGPLVVATTAIPAGRIADRVGALPMTVIGLICILTGSIGFVLVSPALGVPGYLVPVAFITAGYAFFQTANNTSVMADVPHEQRGVVSGLLNLSRNLGLISGASAMGAIFATVSGADDVKKATSDAIAHGMHATYGIAAGLILLAIAIVLGSRFLVRATESRV